MAPVFLGIPLWPEGGPTLIQIALLVVVTVQLVAVITRRRNRG